MNYVICVCRGKMVNILSILKERAYHNRATMMKMLYIFRLSARNSWTKKRLREGFLEVKRYTDVQRQAAI